MPGAPLGQDLSTEAGGERWWSTAVQLTQHGRGEGGAPISDRWRERDVAVRRLRNQEVSARHAEAQVGLGLPHLRVRRLGGWEGIDDGPRAEGDARDGGRKVLRDTDRPDGSEGDVGNDG